MASRLPVSKDFKLANVRAVLMTSDGLRHRHVAWQLSRGLHLCGVVAELKAAGVSQALPGPDQATLNAHFAERDRVESSMLPATAAFPDTELLSIAAGTVNSQEVFDWVNARQPDVVVLYGTGVIRQPLLDAYADRMVNLHLGLSPYYRGAGTNFWPLVNGEPEYVGATIHDVHPAVDAGPILAQVRPQILAGDRAHEIGTRTILMAAAALPQVIQLKVSGQIRGVAQNLTAGRVYRVRDFNGDAVRLLWQHLENGMIDRYLEMRERRLAAAPIVSLPGVAAVASR